MNTPQKEHQVTEPVIMAIVEDTRMLQSLPQPAAEPTIQAKSMPAKVSIPTDESIDEAILVVSKNANANYENFADIAAATTKTLAQIKVEANLNWEDPKTTVKKGADIPGQNLGVYTMGEGPEFCAAKCHADKNCRGYNYVKPGANSFWVRGGCCTKTWDANAPSFQGDSNINFYTVTPSTAIDASPAQIGAQMAKDLAAATSNKAREAIIASYKAAEDKKIAEAEKKKKEEKERIDKILNKNRRFTDSTANKYPNTWFKDSKATDSSKGLYATGGANDANGPELCSAKCNMDPTCRGFQYIYKKDDPKFGGTGGCQYFSHSVIDTADTVNKTPIQDFIREDYKQTGDTFADSYVIKPSVIDLRGKTLGTRAQFGFADAIANVQDQLNKAYSVSGYTKLKDQGNSCCNTGTPTVGGSIDECRKNCDNNPQCKSFAYLDRTKDGARDPKVGVCFYKTISDPFVPSRGIDTFVKFDADAQEKINKAYEHPGYTKLKDQGNSCCNTGTPTVGGSIDECRKNCDKNPFCKSFAYLDRTQGGALDPKVGVCFYKTISDPFVPSRGIDTFVKKK